MSEPVKNWKSIIWREIRHSHDPDYAEYLYLVVASGYFSWFKKLLYQWKSRALAGEVEAALYQISRVEWSGNNAWARYLRRLEREKDDDIPLETLVEELENYHWLKRFIARHVLFYRGGEAVDLLETIAKDGSSAVEEIAEWLIKSIGAETSERLAQEPEHWICTQCFTGCSAYRLLWKPILTYYGCRICKRSYGLIYSPKAVVCIINRDWSELYQQNNESLAVNWLKHRTVFDFNRVEIIQATDEDVERFAMNVGNDTDPQRRAKYDDLHCKIAADCHLSENTLRILQTMFGTVEKEL